MAPLSQKVHCVSLMLLIAFRCCPSSASSVQSAPPHPAANSASLAIATRTSEYCNMETFRARCQHSDVIVMETVLFGRMRVGRCIKSDAYLTALQQLDPTSLGCSADVLSYVDRVCSGRTSCDVNIPNADLYNFQPCSAQLTMYLEASYSCVAVVEEDRSCEISVQVGSRLHVAGRPRSDVSDSRVRCGSRSHPWLLEAQTGQQVNISLLDFSGHGRRTQLDTGGLVSDDCSPAHVHYGYIVDKRNTKNISICSTAAQQRRKHVYMSAGSAVEIVLATIPEANGDKTMALNFLLAFEAVGCSNLVPPSDAWLRRTDNEATVGCYTTRQRWSLRCHGNQWKGTVGVCSSTHDLAVHTVQHEATGTVEDNSKFFDVLLIVSISFVGLAVCLIIIFVGIGCARRYGVDKMSTGGRNRLVGCMDDPLIAGPQDTQYNGQSHSQRLPQYFVLDKDTTDSLN